MNDDEPTKPSEGVGPPPLDQALVERIVGKRHLIGLTYLEHTGDFVEQTQLHGLVEEASMEAGIVVRLNDGRVWLGSSSEPRRGRDLRRLRRVSDAESPRTSPR